MFDEVLKLYKGTEVKVCQPIAPSKHHTFTGNLHVAHEAINLLGDWYIQEKNIVLGFSAEDVEKITLQPKVGSKTGEVWVHIELKFKRK